MKSCPDTQLFPLGQKAIQAPGRGLHPVWSEQPGRNMLPLRLQLGCSPAPHQGGLGQAWSSPWIRPPREQHLAPEGTFFPRPANVEPLGQGWVPRELAGWMRCSPHTWQLALAHAPQPHCQGIQHIWGDLSVPPRKEVPCWSQPAWVGITQCWEDYSPAADIMVSCMGGCMVKGSKLGSSLSTTGAIMGAKSLQHHWGGFTAHFTGVPHIPRGSC